MGQGPLERRTDRTRADRVEGPAGVASDHSGRQPLRPVLDEGFAAAATSCRVVVGRAVDALGPTVQPAEVPPGRWAQGAGGVSMKILKRGASTVPRLDRQPSVLAVGRALRSLLLSATVAAPRSPCCLLLCLCSFVSTVLVSARPGVGVNIFERRV